MIAPARGAGKWFFSPCNCWHFGRQGRGAKIIKTPNSGPLDAKAGLQISSRSLRAGSKEFRSIPAPQPPGLFWAGPSGCNRVRFKPQIQKGLSCERPFFFVRKSLSQRSASMSALRIAPGECSPPFCTKTTTVSAPFCFSSATGTEVRIGEPDHAPRFRHARTTLK